MWFIRRGLPASEKMDFGTNRGYSVVNRDPFLANLLHIPTGFFPRLRFRTRSDGSAGARNPPVALILPKPCRRSRPGPVAQGRRLRGRPTAPGGAETDDGELEAFRSQDPPQTSQRTGGTSRCVRFTVSSRSRRAARQWGQAETDSSAQVSACPHRSEEHTSELQSPC